MLEVAEFNTKSMLVIFVNEQKIKKENIVKIERVDWGNVIEWVLFYWIEK